MMERFWKGKKVFVTGHTGFKGGWLSLWLNVLGAEVCGYALEPPTDPSFFKAVRLDKRVHSIIADIRDAKKLEKCLSDFGPEIVFHLAAQPIGRRSYENPVETFSTNLLGTVHLLEAIRNNLGVRSCVLITSDKCYENNEWDWGYREIDSMGGRDPYSASKGCAELAIAAYRRSFFEGSDCTTFVGSTRAGNVIGGGDWARERHPERWSGDIRNWDLPKEVWLNPSKEKTACEHETTKVA